MEISLVLTFLVPIPIFSGFNYLVLLSTGTVIEMIIVAFVDASIVSIFCSSGDDCVVVLIANF